MHPAIPPAALSLTASVCLALAVASRRGKREQHWLVLALLVALSVWTLGSLLRFTAADLTELHSALQVLFLGCFFAPPLWLLVAASYARERGVTARRPPRSLLLLPSALAYLAVLTNDRHHLVIGELSFEALEAGGMAWAGPAFWAFIAWAYACSVAGGVLYLVTARRLAADRDRPRGLLLACAAVVPLLGSAVYLFGLLPVRFDLTPSALVVSLALISVAVFRYQALEALPLARRDVIEHLQEGVLIANQEGQVLDLNPAAARILGCEAASLLGRPLSEALAALGDGEGVGRLHAELGRLVTAGPPLLAEVRCSDERLVEAHVAWVRDDRGEATGQFVVLRDRTEERRYERVVRHAQKLRTVGTLASGIAHEVNNPLAFIRANLVQMQQMGEEVEAALSASDTSSKLAEDLVELRSIAEDSLDGIDRIERIVAAVRGLASPREAPLRRVDVNAVVEDALRLSNLVREPGLRLERALAEGLPGVEAAPERLVQALLNLLVNARQAVEPGRGRIRLETRAAGDTVEIVVADDGPGVPAEIRERVFDPFFTTKDPDQGTGLGLSIAFDILREHGGALELREGEGPGACFVAVLPARRDEAPASG